MHHLGSWWSRQSWLVYGWIICGKCLYEKSLCVLYALGKGMVNDNSMKQKLHANSSTKAEVVSVYCGHPIFWDNRTFNHTCQRRFRLTTAQPMTLLLVFLNCHIFLICCGAIIVISSANLPLMIIMTSWSFSSCKKALVRSTTAACLFSLVSMWCWFFFYLIFLLLLPISTLSCL